MLDSQRAFGYWAGILYGYWTRDTDSRFSLPWRFAESWQGCASSRFRSPSLFLSSLCIGNRLCLGNMQHKLHSTVGFDHCALVALMAQPPPTCLYSSANTFRHWNNSLSLPLLLSPQARSPNFLFVPTKTYRKKRQPMRRRTDRVDSMSGHKIDVVQPQL